ncbi:MAG: hypothetical protein IKA16_03015 [Oscillospiraceae bacterium]|nr:hypothetical protein [Oscillospiraceae bacterium]
MNGKDLLVGLGNISHKYYEEAETATLSVPKSRKSMHKALQIAAVIALLAVTVTACAYAIRRIRMNLVQHNIPAQTETVSVGGEQAAEPLPVNVLTDYSPRHIPQGYEILCGSPLNYTSRNLQYCNANGNSINFWISTKPPEEEAALRPPVEEAAISLACGEAILRRNEGAQTLRWQSEADGYYANLFTDDVTVDLAAMADSVGLGKSVPLSVWYHRGQEWEPWYPQLLPEGYMCEDVSPISGGSQIMTFENGSGGYIRYCLSTVEDLTAAQISGDAYLEETKVDGFSGKLLCNQEQRILFLENREEGFYAFLETMDDGVDLAALAESIAPGETPEVSKSYLGPDFTIELEQEPTTYIEWQSIYPQEIPEGYKLDYVGDRAYGQQSIDWKNEDGDVISYILYFRLGQYGREFDGSGEPETVSIHGHTGYRIGNNLLWADEELGFAYKLYCSGNVDLIALAESVGPGPELELTNDTTEAALEQLGDYRITALPKNMVEDGLLGAPLEGEDDWYSYVRRWYYDKTNNDQIYFTYETYLTDQSTEEAVLRLFVSYTATSEPEFVTIQGHPGMILQDGDRAYAVWMVGDVGSGVCFQLYSEQFSAEALLGMAQSIQKQ